MTGRPRSVVAHPQQWAHCQHDGTAPLPGGGIELGWTSTPDAAYGPAGCAGGAPPAGGGGLVFDAWCVGFRSDPASGSVVAVQPGRPSATGCPGAYVRPAGLTVDAAHRLYVADPGAREVVVVDLDQRRVLARHAYPTDRPIDLTADCGRALLLLRHSRTLVRLEGRRRPRSGPRLIPPRCPAGLAPARITTGPIVLWRSPDGESAVLADPDGTVLVELGRASDVDRSPTGLLVVAGRPGEPFRRFEQDSTGWVELEPVGCPGYDGGAIAHTPAGRIIYTTEQGVATTTGPQTRHNGTGTTTSYRLDSGAYGTRWGRIFLDACLPPRTRVGVRFLTTDDDEVLDPVGPTDDDYPPLPSAAALAAELESRSEPQAIFRRPTGAERSWSPDEDGFATYEAPARARPGRYLWFQLTLSGTDRLTPRVRAVRIERTGHALLNSLPLAWSRSETDADFLQRYLAPVDGVLDDLDWRSAQRSILIDPTAAPIEKLDWLAGFAGLVLDRRWPEAARRRLVAEAYQLFARRGTAYALLRVVELYLGRAPRMVENWQLRGLGGAVLGVDPDGPAAPRVGGSASATGSLGRFAIGGGRSGDPVAFRATAHRATILIPGTMTVEQRQVLGGLLETHRPAHVLLDVCELGTGMRVGTQLRVDLSSFVGPGERWRSMVLGEAALGSDALVGDGALADGWRVGEVGVGCRRVR